MKYLYPATNLPDGRTTAILKTEEACANAIDALRDQIKAITNQLMSGRPPKDDETDPVDWERRARLALKLKRDLVNEIVCAVELAKEERRRQLVGMRLARQEHGRKMQRIANSNALTEASLKFFRDEVKVRVSSEEYEDIWEKARAARTAAEGERS